MLTFTKKPITISAELFHPDTGRIPMGVIIDHDGAYINTLEGRMRVDPGSMVITGVKGEKYACHPDVFLASYDATDERGAALLAELALFDKLDMDR